MLSYRHGHIVFILFVFVNAAGADDTIEFSRDVQPILNQHCLACHGGVKQAADLSFVYADQLLGVIEPGSVEDSVLIERIMSDDDEIRMPPPDHGPALSDQEIDLIRKWIQQGAEWQGHWAYDMPVRSTVRPADPAWCRQPIDYFVKKRLEVEGLQPSREAQADRWLRRASLDLTGLPPTLQERSDFLIDVKSSGETAYEAAIDRLLASPHFGERWASIWLDAIRYADSKGLGQDGRRTIWKYRDWVIQAFNDDMPFDEFTIKQIAGDLLENRTMDDLIATACFRLTHTNEEGGTDDEQFRIEAVIDRVNTTWQTWQGLTFGCVQCHNHPYEPIEHEDYYRFFAYFNNTTDCDLSNDEPRLHVPLDEKEKTVAHDFDRQISVVGHAIWQRQNAILSRDTIWRPVAKMSGRTSNQTRIEFLSREGHAEFHVFGTISQNTAIELDIPIPDTFKELTAIRLLAMPDDPELAARDSEWGFVVSSVKAELIKNGSDPIPIDIAEVWCDEPDPYHDPNLSLDEKSSGGFSAYSRIHHARKAALVLNEPIDITENSSLRLTLSHKVFELGAFPLVIRRGQIDLSEDESFQGMFQDPVFLSQKKRFAELKAGRAKIKSVAIPILKEREPHLLRPTYVFDRGNFLNKTTKVGAGIPRILSRDYKSDEFENRISLAKWLTSSRNPLTARVTVNRIWVQLFQTGLVRTQEDFGSSGEPPSHPKLLDDLAVRFSTSMGWKMKKLIRELTLSSTYRQTNALNAELSKRDPDNRLLARGPRKRLPAETVRDQALAISGLLSKKRLGPPVHPPLPPGVWQPFQAGDKWITPGKDSPDRYRRTVYAYTKRSIPYPVMSAFDAPSREFCTQRRLPSNTPIQALMTLNDSTFDEAARAFAERMRNVAESFELQIQAGVLMATSRQATTKELSEFRNLFDTSVQLVKANGVDEPIDVERWAIYNIAVVLLNLDEVLCK